MTRPSPEIAGSMAGAFGWAPEGVRASRNWGCRAALAGDATAMAATAAIGNARRAKRLGNDIGTKSFRSGAPPPNTREPPMYRRLVRAMLEAFYPAGTLHDRERQSAPRAGKAADRPPVAAPSRRRGVADPRCAA